MNVEELKARLIKSAKNYIDDERIVWLNNAIQMALQNTDNQKNNIGISYIEESFELAIIATKDIGLGMSAIISVILYRSYESGKTTEKTINQLFPEHISAQVNIILKGIVEANKLDNKRVFGLKDVEFNEKIEHRS